MSTLAELTEILFGSDGSQGIIQDSSFYASATQRINAAVTAISGGLQMPDRRFSPPMADLRDIQTVTTSTSLPYVALPAAASHVYQRNVFMVADSSGNQLYWPKGGDYYTFTLFVRNTPNKALDQAGAIHTVCVSGSKLYYQGIPSSAKTLTVHFYRAPVAMVGSTTTPDGLPAHLAERLITFYVAKEIYSLLEDGADNTGTGYKIYTTKFFEVMNDLLDFMPDDGEPEYYGGGSFFGGRGSQDRGIVD